MTKEIIIYIFVLAIIILAPYPIFKDCVEFDPARFLTEYYKFICNAFLISLLILWVKRRQDRMAQIINSKNRKITYNLVKDNLKNNLDQNQYLELHDKLMLLKDVIPSDFSKAKSRQLSKSLKYSKTLNDHNVDNKISLPEFKETIDFINSL